MSAISAVARVHQKLLGADHLERPAPDVVAPRHDDGVSERAGLFGQRPRVHVGLVLAWFRAGQCRAREQAQHPGGIGFGDGEARDAAAPQGGRHAPGVVEQVAVGRRTRRRHDRGLFRIGGGSRLEESDHSVRTAA